MTNHVIIGTAGTLLDWAIKSRSFDPKLINMFVLDEADVMIDQQGQQDQTIRVHKWVGLLLMYMVVYLLYRKSQLLSAYTYASCKKKLCAY